MHNLRSLTTKFLIRDVLLLFLLFTPLATKMAFSQNYQDLDRLLSRGKNKELLCLIDSFQTESNNPQDFYFYRAKAYEGLMHYPLAYNTYKEWYQKDTTNLDALVGMARMANLSGRKNEAQKIYEHLTFQDSLSFSLNYPLARIYQQNGKLFKAINTLLRLVPSDSTNISLLTTLGDCYNTLGMFPGAIFYYDKAFEQNPYDSNVAIKKANVVIEYQKYLPDSLQQAHSIIEKALAYSPESTALRQSKAILQFMERNYLECDSLLTQIIAEGDSSKINFKYQGLSRVYRKKYFDARRPLSIADSLFKDQNGNRTDREITLKYTDVLGRCGDRKLSLEILKEFEEQLQPSKSILTQINMVRGMVYNYEQDRTRAAKAFWKAYALSSSNQALSNYVNLFYGIILKEKKESMTQDQIREALFAHLLFLQKIPDENPKNENSMHAASRKIIYQELESMFMRGENQLLLKDPDGKKISYNSDEIKRLLTLE